MKPKEAIEKVVHFSARREARNLQYTYYPNYEAFQGQIYHYERVQGNVRGKEIVLEVLHNNGEHLIMGHVGAVDAAAHPKKGMKVFNRYVRHLRPAR